MSESAAKLSFLAQITGESDVSSKVKSMGGAMRQFGSDSEQAATQSEKVTASTGKLVNSMKDTTLSFTAAASSLTSLYFQYDALGKAELRVDKAETALTSSRAGLISSQTALNELVDKGVNSGPQYEEALLRLQAAKDKVKNSTETLSQAEGDLSQAQIQFALGAVPTAISAATSLVNGLKNVNFSALSARVGMLAAGGSAVASGAQFQLTGAMANVGAVGIRQVGIASRLTQIAMGPLGWIMLGIGTLFTLIATNAFGFRDAINSVGEAIGNAIPILKPFLDLLAQIGKSIFPDTAAAAEDYEIEIASAGQTTETFTTSIGETGRALKDATDDLQTFEDWLVKTEKSTIATTEENLYYLESLGKVKNISSLTNEQINLAANYHKDLQAEVARTTQENFHLVASMVDFDTALQGVIDGSLGALADGLREIQEETDKTKSKLGSIGGGRDIVDRARDLGWVSDKSTVTRRPGGGISIVTPHAQGGIVNEPTFMIGLQSGRLGIMGEAGPEAIVPMISQGGGGPTGRDLSLKIEIPVILDGRQIAKVVGERQVESIG